MVLNRMSFIKAWFIFDAIIALFPPFYWLVNRQDSFFGYPATLVYFLLVSCCITASVVVAYVIDPNRGYAR